MRVIDNFLKYMEYKHLNDNEVTTQCGLAVGVIGKAKNGRNDIGKKTIEKILATYSDLNRVWLLTGEGSMIVGDVNGNNNAIGNSPKVSTSDNKVVDKLINEISAQRESYQSQIDRLMKIIENLTNK